MPLFYIIGTNTNGLIKENFCLFGVVCECIMEEMYLCEMFLSKEIILRNGLLSHFTYLNMWFHWKMDDLSLFDH